MTSIGYRFVGSNEGYKSREEAEKVARNNKGNEIIVKDEATGKYQVVTSDKNDFADAKEDPSKFRLNSQKEKFDIKSEYLGDFEKQTGKKANSVKIVELCIDIDHDNTKNADAIFKPGEGYVKDIADKASGAGYSIESFIDNIGINILDSNDKAIQKTFNNAGFKNIAPKQARFIAEILSEMKPEERKKFAVSIETLNSSEKEKLVPVFNRLDKAHLKSAVDCVNKNSSWDKSMSKFDALFDKVNSLDNKIPVDFKQTWKKARDASDYISHDSILSGLENQEDNVAKLKQKIGKHWNADVENLVNIFKNKGMATTENLQYIEKVAERHSDSDKVKNIVKTLSSFMSDKVKVPDYIDKKELIKDGLHDIAYPSNINQANRGTCSATAVQMKIAIENPDKYIDIMTTLACNKPYGTVKPNNTWHEESTLTDIKNLVTSGLKTEAASITDERTLSCKVMENAFMGAARKTGEYKSNDYKKQGLMSVEQEKLLKDVTGDDYKNMDRGEIAFDKIYAEINDEIARGRTVPISFKGHAVLLVGIDNTQTPSQVIIDSWGKQFKMSVNELKQHIESIRVIVDPDKKTVDQKSNWSLGL